MVYFISGHRDLTLEEFEKYYVPKLQRIFEDDSNIKYEFIVGDWGGCDKLFLDYIHNDFITEDTSLPITIVYVDKPRYENIESKHKLKYIQLNSYDECDEYMTKHSDFDIAWVREGREDSYTFKNIKRRFMVV